MPVLSFKGTALVYLLFLNRKRIPLSNLLINCIYDGSAPQILSLKDDYTFPFSNFIIF